MKNVLITSFDMEIGGVERSLASMLDHFDYQNHQVDLMLYKHQGDFMNLLSKQANLLEEIPQYTTFRMSIHEIFKAKHYGIGFTRILSKLIASVRGRWKGIEEPGIYQMQLMWKYALPFLPKLDKEYDIAISYLWPHYFVAEKVQAKTKIAWIHTDYQAVETDEAIDEEMWDKFDYIVAVSDACAKSFIKKYKRLAEKLIVIENIISPTIIRKLAEEEVINPMNADSRYKLITVARLSHAKGIDLAIKALKRLKERGYQNIAWYVVGYGGDESKLKELIAKYGLENDFILLGKKINPYPYMKVADLYVQPSRYEGKAVTVREAQILANPVLITNYTTSQSQVRNNFNGLICELSADGIADGVAKIYQTETLKLTLIKNCLFQNYDNRDELNKLYQLIQSGPKKVRTE